MPLLKANDFWKPNTYYYATDRYKSLIENDNTLYICSESHLSQDEFDATKFVGISGSGGADLSERYAGEWNLDTNGVVTLGEAVPDPTKSTGYLTISDDVFKYIGDGTPLSGGEALYDYVVANGASPINSGTRSMKVNYANLGTNFLLFGIVNNNNTVADLLGVLQGVPSSASGILIFLHRGMVVYTVNNGVIDELNAISLLISAPTENEPIYLDLNTATGSFSITVTGASDRLTLVDSESKTTAVIGNTATFPAILDLANFTTDTFAPFFGTVFELATDSYPTQNITFDLGTTELGRLPFLSPIFTINAPENASDGKVYKVVGNGVYLSNPPLSSGDYVEFSENLQKLIITRPARTNAEISNIALARVVEELERGGVIYDSINEFTTQTIVVVNGFAGNEILASSSYVELSNSGVTGSTVVTIPVNVSGDNLKVGQRLYIMSKFTSSSVRLSTIFPANQIGLPEVSAVTAGVTYEYVIVRIVSNKAVWLRIK